MLVKCVENGDDLGMTGDIVSRPALLRPFAEDLSVINDHGTDTAFAIAFRDRRQAKTCFEKFVMVVGHF
jgi:hypothetical protein